LVAKSNEADFTPTVGVNVTLTAQVEFGASVDTHVLSAPEGATANSLASVPVTETPDTMRLPDPEFVMVNTCAE
jgi:hypothetical protein